MPTKRSYGSLTGGTGDVNPQTYSLPFPALTNTAAVNTTRVTGRSYPLPVPKFSSNISKSVVFEILGVQWEVNLPEVPDTSGETIELAYSVTTSGYPSAGISVATAGSNAWVNFMANPTNVSLFRKALGFVQFNGTDTAGATTGGGSQIYDFNLSEYDDLTDEAGHGILVATDNIFINAYARASTSGGVTSPEAVATLHYRLKEVALQEYIGIVQSQQGPPAF